MSSETCSASGWSGRSPVRSSLAGFWLLMSAYLARPLGLTLQRLETIKSWINEDRTLIAPIARVVGYDEARTARKNLAMNIALSTIFLIAGWLLSNIATPTYLGNIFRH